MLNKHTNIQTKIISIAVIPVVLISAILIYQFTTNRITQFEQSQLDDIARNIEILAEAHELSFASRNLQELQQTANAALRLPNVVTVKLYTASGDLLASKDSNKPKLTLNAFEESLRETFSDNPIHVEITANVLRKEITLTDEFNNEAESQLASTHQIIGMLQVGIDLSAIAHQQMDIVHDSIIKFALAILITIVLAIIMGNTVIGPIKEISTTIEKLRNHQLSSRSTISTNGELAVLQSGVNTMAESIEHSQKRLQQEITEATQELTETLKQLEERNDELKEAQIAAQTASDFKSQFLANISHEIRTPMNVILGYSELLSRETDDPQLRDFLSTINKSAGSLLELLNDILDMSKIESGKMYLENTEVDISVILEDIYQILTPLSQQKSVQLFVKHPPSHLCHIMADPVRLRQVLLNLASNAVKFTHTGHVLIRCLTHARGEQIDMRFDVQDTGIGIPRTAQKRLFMAFSQVDMSTTRRYGGTGLGLHICNEIIELMDGEMHFESEVGKGSTFSFSVSFPIASKETLVISDQQHAKTTLPPIHLISQYTPFAKYETSLFTKAGCELYSAKSARQAEHCAIVVSLLAQDQHAELDIPDLRTQFPTSTRPWLAYLNTYSLRLQNKLNALGYDGYLLKTSSSDKLRTALLHELSAHHAIPLDSLPSETESSLGYTPEILVVDDHDVNLKLMSNILDTLNANNHPVNNGLIALKMASEMHFDLIFLDLHMPHIDGFEFAERLRSSDSINAKTPIIAVTADTLKEKADQAFRSGINDLLTKPISIKGLTHAIQKWAPRPFTYDDTSTFDSTYNTVSEQHTAHLAIDIEHGIRLANGNTELANELLEMLVNSLDNHQAEIEKALAIDDYAELQTQLHSIKGASSYCGTPKLHDMSKTLEAKLKQGDTSSASREANAILKHFDDIRTTHTQLKQEA